MLGVDPATSMLLVTGPEFIYNEILKRVRELDRPELGVAPEMQMLPLRGGDIATIKSILSGMYGNKIEFLIEGEEDGSTGSGSPAGGVRGADSSADEAKSVQQQQEQARAAFMNAISAQQAPGQRRGQGGRGRGGRGGERQRRPRQ